MYLDRRRQTRRDIQHVKLLGQWDGHHLKFMSENFLDLCFILLGVAWS